MTFYNGSVSSLRMGKMPGWQIAIYNKRREVLKRRKEKEFWWEVWGLDPKNRNNIVWRAELRAGKNALRKAQIDRFEDLDTRLPNLLLWTLQKAQLKAPGQIDSNRTRQHSHELWHAVEAEVRRAFAHQEPAIKPERIVEIHRAALREIIEQQVKGSVATLALAMGIPPERAHTLDMYYARLVRDGTKQDPEAFARKYAQRQERHHFIQPNRRSSGAT